MSYLIFKQEALPNAAVAAAACNSNIVVDAAADVVVSFFQISQFSQHSEPLILWPQTNAFSLFLRMSFEWHKVRAVVLLLWIGFGFGLTLGRCVLPFPQRSSVERAAKSTLPTVWHAMLPVNALWASKYKGIKESQKHLGTNAENGTEQQATN